MATLTSDQVKLLAELGIPHEAVAKAQAAKAKKSLAERAQTLLAEPLAQVIADAPMTESSKSAWTGTTVTFDLDGYGVKIVVTDKAATKAREATLKGA